MRFGSSWSCTFAALFMFWLGGCFGVFRIGVVLRGHVMGLSLFVSNFLSFVVLTLRSLSSQRRFFFLFVDDFPVFNCQVFLMSSSPRVFPFCRPAKAETLNPYNSSCAFDLYQIVLPYSSVIGLLAYSVPSNKFHFSRAKLE